MYECVEEKQKTKWCQTQSVVVSNSGCFIGLKSTIGQITFRNTSASLGLEPISLCNSFTNHH